LELGMPGSLKMVARELAKYKWGYRRYDKTTMALNRQVVIHFSMKMGRLIIT
jgi:hypothetical protein